MPTLPSSPATVTDVNQPLCSTSAQRVHTGKPQKGLTAKWARATMLSNEAQPCITPSNRVYPSRSYLTPGIQIVSGPQPVPSLPALPGVWPHHTSINEHNQPSRSQAQGCYVCGTCYKAFPRPSSLKIHYRSHTREKPFQCGHKGCNKMFGVLSNMKRHERNQHARQGIKQS